MKANFQNATTSGEVGPTIEMSGDRYLTLLRQVLTASLFPESAWMILRNQRGGGIAGKVKQRIIRQLGSRNLLLVKKRPYDPDLREIGRDFPMFGYSMIGHRRLENVEECLRSVVSRSVKGDFVECGVWRGGASIYAKAVLNELNAKDRLVWLADSFEGMPVQTDEDKTDIELASDLFLAVSLDEVQKNFRRFDLLDDKVRFLKGWFSDTLKDAPIDNIAVLRLDGDYYSSTMDALEALYDRVAPGGYIIIDDYQDFESCRKAVGEYCERHGIRPNINRIDQNGVYWQKA